MGSSSSPPRSLRRRAESGRDSELAAADAKQIASSAMIPGMMCVQGAVSSGRCCGQGRWQRRPLLRSRHAR
eukprot:5800869-Prymnesium_polylepis.1